MTSRHSFLLKRAFSLLGVFPLAVYVFVHLYRNLTALQGPEAFNAVYESGRSQPLIVPLMILSIWLPFAFHGLYGLAVMKQASPNLGAYPTIANLKYVLQRVSGLGLLLFIPAHVYKTRIAPGLEGGVADFDHMAHGLAEPLTLAVYLLGILGAAFHVANGLWQASIGWGLTVSVAGQRRMMIVSGAVFAGLLAMGYGALFALARAGAGF